MPVRSSFTYVPVMPLLTDELRRGLRPSTVKGVNEEANILFGTVDALFGTVDREGV